LPGFKRELEILPLREITYSTLTCIRDRKIKYFMNSKPQGKLSWYREFVYISGGVEKRKDGVR
jgi:hypothetical protein